MSLACSCFLAAFSFASCSARTRSSMALFCSTGVAFGLVNTLAPLDIGLFTLAGIAGILNSDETDGAGGGTVGSIRPLTAGF
uniref:Putative secreted protein n=1 Tax=Anopheles marajoara TaxID=58244 RepID=A0A2M4CBA3_9DIPT